MNALYTATCGGHTEDVRNVFRQEDHPYLRGVRCHAEAAVLEAWRRTLRGAPPPPAVSDPSGAPLGEAPALLALHGVISGSRPSGEEMLRGASHNEIEAGVSRLLALAGKKPPTVTLPRDTYPSVVGFAVYLVRALGWERMISLLLNEPDTETILGTVLVPRGLQEGREETAYLIKEGILPPRLGPGEDFMAPVSRGLLARALHRLLLRYDALGLERGIYRASRGNALILVPEDRELQGLAGAVDLRVSPDVILSREDEDGGLLVGELTLMPGDRVAYLRNADGLVVFLRQQANVKGASDDRFTPVYQWSVAYTREELEAQISQRASIGQLVDVVPIERGVSGRVSALRVVGSRGQYTFRGFGIRSLLGLRENLFVVDRQRGRGGRVERFLFSGKGWGHGVGLCQVGAYGMALRGARYDEILQHYYTGVEIVPIPE